MAEFPALPLFTDAYMADTRHLTTVQHGAYLLLLMTAWRMPDCRLPDDDRLLARWAGMDYRNWIKTRPFIIEQFWQKTDDGKLQQNRLLDERKFADTVRRKNSAAGKASALKRLNRGSTSVPTKLQPESNPLSHTLSHKEEKGKPFPSYARWAEFKTVYPKTRAGSWQKAEVAYRAAIGRGNTEDQLLAGVKAYAASDEVARGFAKGAAAWLNDDRFLNDYSPRPLTQATTYPATFARKEPFKRNVETIGGRNGNNA